LPPPPPPEPEDSDDEEDDGHEFGPLPADYVPPERPAEVAAELDLVFFFIYKRNLHLFDFIFGKLFFLNIVIMPSTLKRPVFQ
jgi:hypothetical protein